ncbi:hypothetical protein [Hoeflea sp. EC-HK425]|uniref:hypothetical protein n=1 Tax=Hoeflea sp. EC-HK425 TaxID=2038388 RepID=UPI0012557046|nr:hypothetical protein [Hoeflea sp. EC-HK425]VVT12251.1 conserved hypothetical protein [Hoeflea sp. EC-HK425]
MMIIPFARTFRFSLAFALTLGMVISAVGASISHLPTDLKAAEQVRHAELAPTTDEHGHSHDDGEFDEQRIGHTHDHNPADHSHETPHLNAHVHLASRELARIDFVAIPESITPGASFRLDRPPKSISLI